MEFKDFRKYMLDLQNFQVWLDKLDDLGVNIWEAQRIEDITSNYIDMINKVFNLTDNKCYGTELDYFLYELDWIHGADVKKCKYLEFRSLENLYWYLDKLSKGEYDKIDISTPDEAN